jgi:predicted RNA-binding Zn-ribbon protein involved in translation (DUF1610 family)
MISGKGSVNRENFVDTSLLLDAVTSLIDAFKQAGYNPPVSVRVDKQAFDKLLEEASKLYSSVNVRDSIANKEFSLASILNIVLEEGKEEVGDQEEHYPPPQEQKDSQQALKSIEDNHEKQHLGMSTTITKYECPDCGATFDTPAGHRKHYQAFHGKLEEPKVIEQTEN